VTYAPLLFELTNCLLKELKEILPMAIIAIEITSITPRQMVQPTETHYMTRCLQFAVYCVR